MTIDPRNYPTDDMTNMDSIIVRHGENDYVALLTASAMQGLPFVDVVSIVYGNSRWHVYAKYASDTTTTFIIDHAIDSALAGKQK